VSVEFPHLQPSQQEITRSSNEERIQWIRQEWWIQYPRAKRILERLADLIDYPPRDRMRRGSHFSPCWIRLTY
jgi:hypothetical protein